MTLITSVQKFLTGFQIGAATGWDIFIVLIFLIAVFIYGFLLGKNRMIILLLASYFSLAIIQVIPWEKLSSLKWLGLSKTPSSSSQIFVFLGIILLFYFLMPRSILGSALRIRKRGDASWPQLSILGLFQIGLFAAILLSFLPAKAITDFSPLVKKIFIGPEAQFVWVTLPILAMVLMRKKRTEE
ncbi:MAG: hypothetical protein A3A94_00165 [Candidatus Portnoybacteria bacterium RIFCSPLOWO2_01_FULL_43_11]|uniref:Uncharacterized protein n=3 Tax=Bacteria candidate phyla TaxID=1783234 RepID=A0A1G2FNJ4_9BACT|nr:MAG: hypothetical protein A2713_00660 [candidate division WWE3 bacterium RIFCSPHIGHO2_01_FULL_35_17]OGZ38314.1 MAG: hypothetical protein A3A94_00165 [Candidatus Portnoybacteria bacterium RIFCSPLOWO2_01_FULL_43_11]OGZ39091.1 MAG: hypothetical protein A3E90_00840 [Candidatus Portnoybacteria bacterium RIFCSPHIGHO2_12_FULL_40_11]